MYSGPLRAFQWTLTIGIELVLPGLLYAARQKLVLSGIELVLPGKLSTAGLPSEEVLLGVATAAASQPPKDTNTYRRTKRGQNTKVPQSGGSLNKVGDEAINEEMLDSVERATTVASSLEWSLAPRNHEGAEAQARSEGVPIQSKDPPLSTGNTVGSEEDSMKHDYELMNNVPPTTYDSPLSGGNTPGSDEGRLKLEELMAMCTKLSKHVLDLEKEKDAQAMEILNLKKRVKKLERKRKSIISQLRRRMYRQVESSDDDLDEEDASK
ncbi:hypothetical protein Tco_0013363 [Tanacetum coccineum]